jgi:hypothetical protein
VAVEEFLVRDERSLDPLLDKLAQHGASVVFSASMTHDTTTAHVRMPPDPADAETCRLIIEDWNASFS